MYLNLLIAITGMGGLMLDIWGVFKLFSVEPIQIKKIDTAVFNATLGDWSKEEKTGYLVNELNQQISEVNNENKRRAIKAVKYRWLLIGGFTLQLVSVGLSFYSSFFKN